MHKSRKMRIRYTEGVKKSRKGKSIIVNQKMGHNFYTVVIIISKLQKPHSKTKRRAPA